MGGILQVFCRYSDCLNGLFVDVHFEIFGHFHPCFTEAMTFPSCRGSAYVTAESGVLKFHQLKPWQDILPGHYGWGMGERSNHVQSMYLENPQVFWCFLSAKNGSLPRNLWFKNTEAPWLETLRLLRSAIGSWSTWKPLDVGSDGRICSKMVGMLRLNLLHWLHCLESWRIEWPRFPTRFVLMGKQFPAETTISFRGRTYRLLTNIQVLIETKNGSAFSTTKTDKTEDISISVSFFLPAHVHSPWVVLHFHSTQHVRCICQLFKVWKLTKRWIVFWWLFRSRITKWHFVVNALDAAGNRVHTEHWWHLDCFLPSWDGMGPALQFSSQDKRSRQVPDELSDWTSQNFTRFFFSFPPFSR